MFDFKVENNFYFNKHITQKLTLERHCPVLNAIDQLLTTEAKIFSRPNDF